MTLSEAVFCRKSTRKFDMQPLDQELLAQIDAFLGEVKPLYPAIEVQILPAKPHSLKGNFSVEAPHYLLFYSAAKEGALVNTGFILQQVALYLTSLGLGTCCLGAVKPVPALAENADPALEYMLGLAFGRAEDSPYRQQDEFRRRPLPSICNKSDPRLEAARLAPSAMNSQPWYFLSNGENRYALYCIKHNWVKDAFLGRLNKIDIGITLTHIYVTCPDTFTFAVKENPPECAGHTYMGDVSF